MSNEIKDGGYAFPTTLVINGMVRESQGMTLRDWFAGMAMMGVANPDYEFEFDAMADYSYKLADAMLAAREVKHDDVERLQAQHAQMLEALKAIVAYEEDNETEYLGMDHIRAYARAKAAIAAAEGRAEG